jgi:hypothetical protein
VRCQNPHLLLGVDDTTDYACEGIQPERSTEWGLVGTSSLSSARTFAIKQVDKSKKMDGTRIQRHFMGSGGGNSAPAVYIISGLTEYKMPNDDFLVIEIKGLCVGGDGVGGSNEKGYIILMRNKKGMQKVRFAWILKNILVPFVEKLRWKYSRFKRAGGQVPEWERAVLWCDGDNSQIYSITSEEGLQLLREHGIIANKHSASRTGAEQGPDLNAVFPTSKKLNKKITLKHVPSEDHTLKQRIELAFAQLRTDNNIRL